MKPLAHGPNMCAEAVAAQAARHAGYELIVGIVIAGEPQEDHKSGLITLTLEPCGNCRTFLSAMLEMREDTEIITVHLENDIHEVHTFGQILTKHNHNSCEK
ncbi:MAG: hypothetical protein A2359_03200 [Candidatus Moranbacteria bacterium RIFOXYB1_FULL_43_19]|nr:MAG: hypothetical protein A2359_03200 [Candidatus Moranbacteria bacterium RIFOXYB1_FULL_43_19]OGI33682.1 MAG: hypothetical protein A2420_02460 [Candidatus Moranbacteria bacterium RIFOXYC1_FULL_44_13]OGI37223.1 MAG: hypothetical protein A2612_04075 [Candidatus Moranbacteria bacterium RIFOXYD1_FULL_44_12]